MANNNQTYESLVIQKTYTYAFSLAFLAFLFALMTWPDPITNWLDLFGHWAHGELYRLVVTHWS